MQNAELQESRDKVETLLETYTDLYDFAPVGYFSIDEQGVILEVNLTGASLLGVERSRLTKQRLQRFVAAPSQPIFVDLLKKIFAGSEKQICELSLLNERGITFWADIQATSAVSERDAKKWCRMAISDITTLKQEEEVRHRLEVMEVANNDLKLEIIQRQKVEADLKKSEAHYAQLFQESLQLQEEFRHLSHRFLSAQEDERKRLSRELHDEIAQALVGINIHLESLTAKDSVNIKNIRKDIIRTQRLVENLVNIVHQFARELRPPVLDDLGLIPALHSFMKSFTARTGVRTHLTAFAGVEKLDLSRRTVFFRVVQEALTNVARHAKASRVEVVIQKLPGGVSLKIKDDGKSFSVKRALHAKGGKHLGLLGMRERLEMIGGSFTIESTPGKGTTVSAEIRTVANDSQDAPKLVVQTAPVRDDNLALHR
jgi:PAS domain S-box-containing protein